MVMKKLVKVIGWSLAILVAVVAVLVFLVLPNVFASSDKELQELKQTNVDSLMNMDVPAAPEVPEVAN